MALEMQLVFVNDNLLEIFHITGPNMLQILEIRHQLSHTLNLI